MTNVLSKLSSPQKAGVAALAVFVAWKAFKQLRSSPSVAEQASMEQALAKAKLEGGEGEGKGRAPRPAVDGIFFRRLWKLLKVMVPSLWSKEVFYVVLVASMLVLRTYCDLWLLRVTTSIESIIISGDRKAFPGGVAHFLMAMLPIACVNNVLKYGLAEMSLRFRARLTDHMYESYMRGFTYYQINNLDNRISNPDQLLTQDLARFAQSVTELYSNLSKPMLDIGIYSFKLTGALGAQGPISMLAYLVVSGLLLTSLRKPTARFTIKEQQLEGQFRYVNSRLITNSEEVAFYQGNDKEREVIRKWFRALVDHIRRAQQFRCLMGVVDHAIGKYLATVVGFFVVSRPFMDSAHPIFSALPHAERMQEYYRSGRMLMNLAMAVGRLVLAGRELTRLAGFTARMTEFLHVLDDLNNNRYQRTMVGETSASLAAGSSGDSDGADGGDEKARGGNLAAQLGFKPYSGKIIYVDRLIRFDGVPLVTPNGDVLVRSLDFEVRSGMNVLICGPNGSGKSSLFRTLGELWPMFGGTMHKPPPSSIFYVPQRALCTLGSLRDQIIYPHSREQALERGYSDEDLIKFLEGVHLGDLPSRFAGGLDAVEDFQDVLSGGEKQRVAMSRLLYHKPVFAILDECTSAVSVDVEGKIYQLCRKLDITLFTVSHRRSLWVHHEYVLHLDGKGSYQFLPREEMEVYGS